MKRFLSGFMPAVFLFFSLSLPCSAEMPREYHWYCKHVKDHEQPKLAPELSFIEELDAYYIDHTHSDANAEDKVIYLTFDAGYENGNVAKILDVLKEEDVTAAFFILGHLVTHDTELVKRMASEGHTVCNHTVRHRNLSQAESEAFLKELRELESLYREHTGEELAKYYRPPEGTFSRENLAVAQENGYKTIFWSFAYPDWDNQKQPDLEAVKQMILSNAHNGEVMLLHPTSSANAAVLGDVIRTLKNEGYRFGSLDELTRGGMTNED
ncbi:MAG: delta-lactam-biosynthetic de-N-acetylase [Ruminococcaceae bacterium]|nr:delta-lactam-biosynthetic de-N-acetylase [Oscillospiraceae bacterium]